MIVTQQPTQASIAARLPQGHIGRSYESAIVFLQVGKSAEFQIAIAAVAPKRPEMHAEQTVLVNAQEQAGSTGLRQRQ